MQLDKLIFRLEKLKMASKMKIEERSFSFHFPPLKSHGQHLSQTGGQQPHAIGPSDPQCFKF